MCVRIPPQRHRTCIRLQVAGVRTEQIDGAYTMNTGARVIGIVESHSAVYNADGLDVIALKDYHSRTGTLLGFPGVAHQLPSTYTCVLRVCIYSCISTHTHTHTHTHGA